MAEAALTRAAAVGGGRWPLSLRLARRELRSGPASGFRGFRIFLACLLLGVAAIAAVGSLAQAMLDGLEQNGRALLGGEAELRLLHREATPAELAWLTANSGRLSETAELRAMARDPGGGQRRLVELKAVDGSYPLYGALATEPAGLGPAALAERDGSWGALVDPALLGRLGLEVGDRLAIGGLDYRIRGTIRHEPDRAGRVFSFGPRVMVALASLPATGLVQPGSLIEYHYRLDLPPGRAFADWRKRLVAALPESGWRIRGLAQAAPGIQRFVEQVRLFMTLVGLTALLVGGVGIANAVGSYLEQKKPTIATLKCLGAPAFLIFRAYLWQVLALALLGTLGGLVVGALVPLAVGPLLSERLNFQVAGGLYPGALALAALFGLLTTLAFSLWPLARAQQVPAVALFRDTVQRARRWPPRWAVAATGLAALALAGTAVLGTSDSRLALGFILGAALALAAFRLAAHGLVRVAERLPRPRRPDLRLALANLHRPGAPTANVAMSLGLGLTVLVAIALIQGNLRQRVLEELPAEAPSFYFIDIQPDEVATFQKIVGATPGVVAETRVPMLRGRITRVNGKRPEDLQIPKQVTWVFQGDRGLTWRATPPEGAKLTEGQWWPADYRGAPLVSLDDEVGKALGLHPGDHLTINVLGRDFTVEIANLRTVEWADLKINFVMIFSPGLLEGAPHQDIATVRLQPGPDDALGQAAAEDALERRVTDALPNVSAIRVKEALQTFAQMLDSIAAAVTATAGVTLLAGTLVLAGAVAAGHRRRIYDAVVLKVLGATRADIGRAFLLEYGLIGLVTALLAALAGSLAAWWVLTDIMNSPFHFLAGRVALTVLLATAVTLLFGFVGTWRALAQKAAPLLRNE
ncbi:putative ABC transport system permease protein [Tistlia consotensis]|uniref:Putative ABC transport system permease protein n=1 Tax=Tistlia consotensis USBA 355 TaxID=560819 RepID=A0A1Y6CVN5_9PROT|nr:FtsX-like permease family protein [Tistlia consotensis]SMF78119.1 putative ABC transport system permease protein [Tistlia consotensis USBA 355]SNS17839.1 putative ABC transport system permease protein [Tistlia consotensis]